MQLRGEPMANPRGATLRPGLWQSNVITPVGGAHFIRGPRVGPLPGNAFQAKGGEEEEVPPSQNLWVGNVTSEITEPMLMERFVKFGEINSISLYPLRNYAFVYFKHIEHAKAAKEGLQGAAMGDSFLKIEFARAAKPNKYLWVGGIIQTVTKEQIEAEFLKFGHVEDLKLFRDRNSAIVAYSKLEDAVSAVKYLNGRQLGSDPIRVDFLRSQSLKRENAVNPNFHADEARDVHANDQRMLKGMSDLVRKYSDTVTCQPEPLIGMQIKAQNAHGIEGGRKQCSPSKILWIRYPDSVNIDEQRLHNSLILFGEIERIKSFPSRHYAFVEFRSVDEARRAKDGSQGRLLNDPRIQILYSSSGFGPMENSKDNSTFVTQFCGSLPHETPSRSGSQFGSIERFGPVGIIDSSNPAGTNVGPRGFDEHHATEGRISLSRPDMFNNFLDVNVNSPGPGSWGKPPPLTDIGLRPVRPLPSSWEGFNANAAQRELKKPRIDVNNANTGALDARTPVQGAIGPQPFRGFSGYVNTNSDNQITGQRGNPGSYLNGGDRLAVGPCHMAPMPSARTPSLQGQGEHFGRVEESICWQGTIAKGGTPVCHARCISVGKSIESKFPEVVNCSARTDLDMLTKHFSQASGFGLVFFVPEQDQDVHPYQEFLRYLGSKHRAGVAKFSDGTTLFLVPPSDFSEHVLKAPRANHLFGVILKFLEQSGSVMQPNPSQTNLHDPLQQLYVQSEQFPISHVGFTQMPIKGDPTICATGIPRSLSPPEDMHSGQTAVPERINQIPGTQSAAISLTPELIATLTSLLPNTFQASSSGGSAAVPNTSTRHDPCDSSGGYDASDNRRLSSSPRSSELWRQHQQPLPLTSHIPRQEHDSEQHHHHPPFIINSLVPFINIATSTNEQLPQHSFFSSSRVGNSRLHLPSLRLLLLLILLSDRLIAAVASLLLPFNLNHHQHFPFFRTTIHKIIMSSNLDHSLDEIIAARPRPNRRGGKGAASAVSGGIRKRSQRAAAQKANASVTPNAVKAATRAPPTGPSGKATKIIVSNLPFDVNEQMIKEYFQSVVGPIRRAILTYGPDGRSRGVATVEFAKSEHAETAAQKYNGVEVDKRPMKVELVVDPSAPASFADRVGAPNKIVNKQHKGDKPKPVVKPAVARGGARGGARGNKRGGRSGSGSGRGKPKTAEQLDQDMSDYFGGDSTNASGAAPAAATTATNGGDVGMDDTVL